MVVISSDLHIFYFYQNKKMALTQMFYISVVIDNNVYKCMYCSRLAKSSKILVGSVECTYFV